MSICWDILNTKNCDIEKIFYSNLVKKEEYFKDPWKILGNKNLVIRFENNLYNWNAAAPLLMSILGFGESLPKPTMEGLLLKKNTGLLSYFKSSPKELETFEINANKKISIEFENNKKKFIEENTEKNIEEFRRSSISSKKRYFIPSSNQLKLLGLKEGKNEITFLVTSRLTGSHKLSAEIYLWDFDSKIVISDVDGTITKSDVLGQIMPYMGSNWAHEDVCKMYTNISKNGYKILYLTARALCQSGQTKGYLQNLVQSNTFLF